MATPVIMPKQGISVESCIITEWFKKKGDKVQVGDVLFAYETDKASFEEEATVSGTLLDVFFEEGDEVPCLTNVCVIGDEGENTDEFRPDGAGSDEAKQEPEAVEVKAETDNAQVTAISETEAATQPVQDGLVKISPRARNLAQRIGIDYRYATPTGPYGRIIERDIEALREKGALFTPSALDEQLKGDVGAIAAGSGLGGRITTTDLAKGVPDATSDQLVKAPAADEVLYEEVKLPNIRKTIARAMKNSLASTAQLTLNTSFDATDILEYRKKIKKKKDDWGLSNITINDIIVYAVSRTLLNHKDLNAHLVDDKIRYFKDVNMGIAVDTDRGLIVPTLFKANRLTLNEIAAESKRLIEQAKSGSISPDYLTNGSFTITNLGTLGIESFTPVLNPPQTGILGVNTIVQRVREVDGDIQVYPSMALSLTFDHCALDGAPAARFLKELKDNLENFSVLLAR